MIRGICQGGQSLGKGQFSLNEQSGQQSTQEAEPGGDPHDDIDGAGEGFANQACS